MKSILHGLTRQYLNAFGTVAAPLWAGVVLLLIGGPWLGLTLMETASRGEFDSASLPANELRLVCHLLAALFFGFGCVVGLFAAPTYVFRLPVSARMLASWQLVVSALTVALCNGVMTVAYRVLFDATLSYAVTLPMITLVHLLIWLGWLFVPALTAASHGSGSLMGAPLRRQLVFTLSRLVRWLPTGAMFAGFVVFRCLQAEESVFWERLTIVDVAALVVVSGLTWKLVVGEMERQRHGEVNVRSLMGQDGESALARMAQQRVPDPGEWALHTAHRWFHWQSGRTLLLQGTLFVVPLLLFVFGAMYLDGNGNRLEGLGVLVTMTPALGALLIGAALGLDSANRGVRREMRKHVAVLPVSDRVLSHELLVNFVRTVSGLWGLVVVLCMASAVLYCILGGVDAALNEIQRTKAWQSLGIWMVPIHLAVSAQLAWTVGGLTATLAWTGREQFFTKVYLGLVLTVMPTFVGIKTVVPVGHQDAVFGAVLGLLGVAAGTLVVWTYLRARQRGLLEPRLVYVALTIWGIEAAVCLTLLPGPLPIRFGTAALIGMGVLPITASPLAVSWNRHR